MSEDLKFWLTLMAAAFGGGITAYVATQAAYWRIDSRIKILEYRTDEHDKRLDGVEELTRRRGSRTTPL